ncbi:MAG: hypothetical protein JNJ88_06745 [Planctomycetes bacterium]|nr:hypothetical protein [Planctomycetota bacterium]
MISQTALWILAAVLPASATQGGAAVSIRPFERRSASLDGPWEARHDPTGEGLGAGYSLGGPSTGWTPVSVPSVLEEYAPFAGKDGVFWLRKKFELQEVITSKDRLRVRFDRAVERCTVWLNGQECGSHEGGDVGFTIDLTPALASGPNTLVVRLEDGVPVRTPSPFRLGGLAGSVSLERISEVSLDDLCVTAELRGQDAVVELQAELASTSGESQAARVRFDLLDSNGEAVAGPVQSELAVPAGGTGRAQGVLTVPAAALWSPTAPTLYTARARVAFGTGSPDLDPADELRVSVGLRSVSAAGARFRLNGKPLRIRAAIDSGYELGTFLRSGSLVTPEKKLKTLQSGGFNALVVPGRLPSEALLRAADTMGVLMILRPSLPAGAAASALDAQILQCRSHASVVWWGFSDMPEASLERVQSLDADALVSRDATDAGLNVILSPKQPPVPYLRPRIALPAAFGAQGSERLLDLGDRGEFAFVEVQLPSAFADVSRSLAAIGGETWREESQILAPYSAEAERSFKTDKLSDFFDSPLSLASQCQESRAVGIQRAIEALRANPNIAGYALPWLSDSPHQPGAGLVEPFYSSLPALAAAKRANLLRRAFLFPQRRAGETGALGAIDLDVGSAADEGEPVKVDLVEVRQPDEISAYFRPMPKPSRPWLQSGVMGFQKGEGIYPANPVWKGLLTPGVQEVHVPAEQAPIRAIDAKSRLFQDDNPAMAKVGDHVVVVRRGKAGSWDCEPWIHQTAEALGVAIAGGTAILLDPLEPEDPRHELGMLPDCPLVPLSPGYVAITDHAAFDGLGTRGLVGEHFGDLAPRYAIRGLKSGERLASAIDGRGAWAGDVLVRVPYGSGFVVLTTWDLGSQYREDVVARRLTANLAAAAPAPPPSASAPPPYKRADLEAQYRNKILDRAARGKR